MAFAVGKQVCMLKCCTLIASIAYSTWKSLPSGENVLTPLSYSDRVRNILQNFCGQKCVINKVSNKNSKNSALCPGRSSECKNEQLAITPK